MYGRWNVQAVKCAENFACGELGSDKSGAFAKRVGDFH